MSIFEYRNALANLILILFLTTNPQATFASEVTQPVTKCFIRIDNPHLSKSIKRNRGFDAVKVNAISICDKDLSDLRITVEIYKEGLLRNHRVASKTLEVKELVPANKRIAHKGTWERCKSKRMSRYFGKAYAEALIQGKNMRTLPVTTEKTISLQCGT